MFPWLPTVDDLITTAGKTIKGNDVALTAGDDITGAAAITAQNDVTISTTGAAGGTNDIDQSGTVSTTGAGTVTVVATLSKLKSLMLPRAIASAPQTPRYCGIAR